MTCSILKKVLIVYTNNTFFTIGHWLFEFIFYIISFVDYNIYDNVINTKDESQSELNNKMSNEKQTRANVGLEKRQDNGNLIIRDFGNIFIKITELK